MSAPCLPEQIAPFKYARQRRHLQGQLPLYGMNRLAQSLIDDQATINVDVQFDVDEQGTSCLRGSLQVDVSMICQRCMAPMPVSLEANVAIGFVNSDEQANNLPDEFEPYLVQSETVALADIIEDELILALPIVALHADQSCEPWLAQQRDESAKAAAIEEPRRKNPFAVLSELKRQ